MKSFRLFTFLLIAFPLFCFSQSDSSKIDSTDLVIICIDTKSQTFHSHDDCIGLETCEGKLKELSEERALEKYDRKVCCICWNNPGKDCKDDNPNRTIDYDYDEPDDEIYLGDFWWLEGGGVYALVGALLGSVILLSNEIFIGTSYSFLPPRLSVKQVSEINTSLGFSLLFRKNFEKDAIEYGFNYHSFEFNTDKNFPNLYENQDRFMFSFSYLHQLNQHFLEYGEKASKVKFYIGPLVTFGSQDIFNNQAVNRFGIGGTGGVSFPLSGRVNIDLRSDITNYSSEVKLGLRWLYQKKYPWQKRRN